MSATKRPFVVFKQHDPQRVAELSDVAAAFLLFMILYEVTMVLVLKKKYWEYTAFVPEKNTICRPPQLKRFPIDDLGGEPKFVADFFFDF